MALSPLEKFEFLQRHHPWTYEDPKSPADVMLYKSGSRCQVLIMGFYWDGGLPDEEDKPRESGYNFAIGGDTWDEALNAALAEAGLHEADCVR